MPRPVAGEREHGASLSHRRSMTLAGDAGMIPQPLAIGHPGSICARCLLHWLIGEQTNAPTAAGAFRTFKADLRLGLEYITELRASDPNTREETARYIYSKDSWSRIRGSRGPNGRDGDRDPNAESGARHDHDPNGENVHASHGCRRLYPSPGQLVPFPAVPRVSKIARRCR